MSRRIAHTGRSAGRVSIPAFPLVAAIVAFISQEGKIILLGNFSVCKKGMPLTTEQAQILVSPSAHIAFDVFSSLRPKYCDISSRCGRT